MRRFQVVFMGSRRAYDSTECALLDADNPPSLRPLRAIRAVVPLERR